MYCDFPINFSLLRTSPPTLYWKYTIVMSFFLHCFRLPGPSRVPTAGSSSSKVQGASNLNRRSQSFNSIDKNKPPAYANGNEKGKPGPVPAWGEGARLRYAPSELKAKSNIWVVFHLLECKYYQWRCLYFLTVPFSIPTFFRVFLIRRKF